MLADRNTLTFTRAELRALLAHASTDETRLHLCALHYEPGSCPPRVFATDGHRLLVGACQGPDRVGDPLPSTSLPRDTLENAIRLARGASAIIVVTLGPPENARRNDGDPRQLAAPGHASVQVYASEGDRMAEHPIGGFFCKLPDVQAPPIDHIMSQSEPDRSYGERSPFVAFNPSYLADLKLVLSAAADTGGDTGRGVRLFPPRQPLDPVYFDCGMWRGLLMPTNSAEEPIGKPIGSRAHREESRRKADPEIAGAEPEALPPVEAPAAADGEGKRKRGRRKGRPDLRVVSG